MATVESLHATKASGAPSVRVLASARLLSLRHCDQPHRIAGACTDLGLALPRPGQFEGEDPLLFWRRPSEYWFVAGSEAQARADANAQALLAALAPGADPLACAVDIGDGAVVVEIDSPSLDDWLAKLVDASVKVREPGQGCTARLAGIVASVLRKSSDRVWIIADRAVGPHLLDWLSFVGPAEEPGVP